MQFNLEQIKEVLKKKKYIFFDRNRTYALNIIGIRSNTLVANHFDDWLYLIYRNEQLEEQVHEFAITTDPRSYWLKNPLHVDGTAILVPGQYIGSHTLGLHKGTYEALTQKAPMKIWRDNTRDSKLNETGAIYEGLFSINIHRSNAASESQIVEKWSAGCQVFQNPEDYHFFMDCCKKSSELYGNSFTYTLLKESDF
jgi:hypothetical protein